MLKTRGFDNQRKRYIREVTTPDDQVLEFPAGVTNGYYMMYSIYPHAGGIDLVNEEGKKPKLVAQSTETEPVADIALYMPGELSSESEIEWESGKSFVKQMGGTRNIIDTLNQTVGGSGSERKKAFSSMGNMALKGVASHVGQKIREADWANDLERLTGQIANSHSEQFFNGIGYRSFSFTYKFQPSSHEETNVVKDIIRVFRRNALPELGSSKVTSFYPSTFEIEFITPHISQQTIGESLSYRNPYMPRLKQLVCTGCNVTYGSGGGSFSSFKDGAPVEVDLELNFTETSKVYMGDVDEGY
tara:strand:- start:6423 stop:7328 length:906 start_codon:yes stop_codon:yes gene_type:complete